MKLIYSIFTIVMITLFSCNSSKYATINEYDDIYYSSDDALAEEIYNQQVITETPATIEDNYGYSDEEYYNEEVASSITNDSTNVTNNFYGNYYENGGYEYTNRINRFHNARISYGYYDTYFYDPYYYSSVNVIVGNSWGYNNCATSNWNNYNSCNNYNNYWNGCNNNYSNNSYSNGYNNGFFDGQYWGGSSSSKSNNNFTGYTGHRNNRTNTQNNVSNRQATETRKYSSSSNDVDQYIAPPTGNDDVTTSKPKTTLPQKELAKRESYGLKQEGGNTTQPHLESTNTTSQQRQNNAHLKYQDNNSTTQTPKISTSYSAPNNRQSYSSSKNVEKQPNRNYSTTPKKESTPDRNYSTKRSRTEHQRNSPKRATPNRNYATPSRSQNQPNRTYSQPSRNTPPSRATPPSRSSSSSNKAPQRQPPRPR